MPLAASRSSMANSCHSSSSSRLLLRPVAAPFVRRRGCFSSASFIPSPSRTTTTTVLARAEASQVDYPNSRNRRAATARPPRRQISISTSGKGWQGEWSCDYLLTLRELQLADLAEDDGGGRHGGSSEVLVSLTIQKHAGFGFSVAGRTSTSFGRRCSWCGSSYSREIDAEFDVWILPCSRGSEDELPEIGSGDPSVIYVKPGEEADLDSLVRDTIRLAASAEDKCSDSCGMKQTGVIWQSSSSGGDGRRFDSRWAKLLELRNKL